MSEIGSVPPTPPVPATSAGGQAATPQPQTPTAPVQGQPSQTPPSQAQPASTQPTPGQAPSVPTPQGQAPQDQPASSGPAPAPSQSAPAPAANLGSSAAQISEALRALANGASFSAQIVARDGAALLVRAASGTTLALNNLAAALEQANIGVLLNTSVRLQLNPSNPQLATVTHANGVALQPALAATAQPPTAAQLAMPAVQSPPAAAASPPPALPQPGQVLTAMVLPPPVASSASSAATGAALPAPALSAQAAAALPPGSQLQLVVQSATLPNTAGLAAVPASAAPLGTTGNSSQVQGAPLPSATMAAMGGATPTSQASMPSSPAMPAAAQPATTAPTAPFTLLAAQAGNPLPAATLSPVGSLITGVVSGQGQAGHVLVFTPQSLLALNLPQALPPGTQIVLEVASVTRPATATPAPIGSAPLGGVLTRLEGSWPAMQQTFDALRAADGALAQRLQSDLLPQPNARLASTALQFMAAAAIGNAKAWLGAEAVRKLEQSGRSDLLRKLDEDFAELGRLNQRQGDQQWQALTMPMLIGGRVEPIQIFMRRRRDAAKKQQQTRFIIDFNLESTGPIQFDGFVSAKQLDLILRSETEFGPAFRVDVSAIFENALQITGMTGSIQFRDREPPLAWPSPELEAPGPSTEVKA
jgi:hypothetical protein